MADAAGLGAVDVLAVVSHVTHHSWDGALWAYGPYVVELELWASLVPRLRVLAPLRAGEPAGDAARIEAENVEVVAQPEVGGDTTASKVKQAFVVPRIAWSLHRGMRGADAIHVRVPGNLGGLGLLQAPLYSRRLHAKYAGPWTDYPGEPRSWRAQKAVCRSGWFSGPVGVYGRRPNDRPHIYDAFSPSMTEADMEVASSSIEVRRPRVPLRLVFVGRLTRNKGVDVILGAVARLSGRGAAIVLEVIGDGSERASLEALAHQLGIADLVHFSGGLTREEVFERYRRSDVLVMASYAEGLGKVLFEGMAFGLVCVASSVGVVPRLLDGGRGFTFPAGDADALAEVIEGFTEKTFDDVARTARPWALRFTSERFRSDLVEVLDRAWTKGSRPFRPARASAGIGI